MNTVFTSHPAGRGVSGGLRSLRWCLGVFVALLVLVGCDTSDKPKAERPLLVVAHDAETGVEIVTTRKDARKLKFWSKENLRDTNFSADATARLGAPHENGPTGFLGLGRINQPQARTGATNSELYDELGAEELTITPLQQGRVIGSQWQPDYSDEPSVSLDYDNEPLEQVVSDILGGILGANFMVGASVEGTLTFRSEERFARSQLVPVLADIRARNGYLIQYFNGVYQIGTQEEIETLAGLRGGSRLDSDETYVIELRNPSPEGFEEIINTLIPPTNQLAIIEGTTNLVVRGDPAQFASIENLVVSLLDTVPQGQRVALFPTRNSPPDLVAEQVNAIYTERGLADVLLVPIVQAPGVLVVARQNRTLEDIGRLVRRLDVADRDAPRVRVIQLKHLSATDIATQLTTVFEGSAVAEDLRDGPANGPASNILAAADAAANRGTDARNGDAGVTAPRIAGGSGAPAADDADPAATPRQQDRPVDGITFAADSRNNLLVRSRYAEFQRISEMVTALDVPLAQVVIEATIVEVDINDDLQYGVQFFLQGSNVTGRSSGGALGAADPGGAGFVALINQVKNGTAVQYVLTALQSVTNVRVISSPYLTVVDGATSRLAVGDQIPFVTASQTSNSDGTVTVTQEVDARDVGVILDVTPRISPDNSVVLDITQEVSSARNVTTAAGDNPIISQRTVTSQITVQSGRTVLLGGLIQERADVSDTGVPVIRKVPGLGKLFSQKVDVQTRSELLIMITPRVVRTAHQLDTLTNQLRKHSNLKKKY
jgi:general secretion pathway protein D